MFVYEVYDELDKYKYIYEVVHKTNNDGKFKYYMIIMMKNIV